MHIKPKKTRTAKVFGQVGERQPAAVATVNSTSDGIQSRGDGFQFSHAPHYHIGIFQSVTGNRANNPAPFRNFSQ
jgi:hypothetical protein